MSDETNGSIQIHSDLTPNANQDCNLALHTSTSALSASIAEVEARAENYVDTVRKNYMNWMSNRFSEELFGNLRTVYLDLIEFYTMQEDWYQDFLQEWTTLGYAENYKGMESYLNFVYSEDGDIFDRIFSFESMQQNLQLAMLDDLPVCGSISNNTQRRLSCLVAAESLIRTNKWVKRKQVNAALAYALSKGVPANKYSSIFASELSSVSQRTIREWVSGNIKFSQLVNFISMALTDFGLFRPNLAMRCFSNHAESIRKRIKK